MASSTVPRWEGDSTPSFVLDLARSLAREGHEVVLVTPHAAGARRYETTDSVQVRRYRYLPDRWERLTGDGGMLSNLRRSPLMWLEVVPLVVGLAFSLIREARRQPPDLIHSHWLLPQGLVSGLVSRILGIPHVATVHGSDAFALRGRVPTLAKRIALRLSDVVTVNSGAVEQVVRQLAPKSVRIHLIPMPVRKRQSVDAHSLPKVAVGRPTILFAGRLVKEKGVADLLQAFARLRVDYADAKLVVVGEGNDRPSFERLALDHRIDGDVDFVGWQPPDAVLALMAMSDVVVGPSHRGPEGSSEAQGLVFVEAMSVGTPVVATEVGGIPDAVHDGETGILVREHDVDGLVAGIKTMLTDDVLRSKIIANGLELVKERYAPEVACASFRAAFAAATDDA